MGYEEETSKESRAREVSQSFQIQGKHKSTWTPPSTWWLLHKRTLTKSSVYTYIYKGVSFSLLATVPNWRFLTGIRNPSLAGFLVHTHIKAETKPSHQPRELWIQQNFEVLKAQPLPCLWSKNEAATAAGSGTCSPLLGNMNIDITVLQAKVTFCVVKFLVLPSGAK